MNLSMSISSKMSNLLAGLFKNPTNVGITDYFFLMMLFGMPMSVDSEFLLIAHIVFWAWFYYWTGKEHGFLQFSKHSIVLLVFYLLVIALSFYAWSYDYGFDNAWAAVVFGVFYLVMGYYAWFKFHKFVGNLTADKQQGV